MFAIRVTSWATVIGVALAQSSADRARWAEEEAANANKNCLPVLTNICGLNILWMVLGAAFILFSTTGYLSMFMPSPKAKAGDGKKSDDKDADPKAAGAEDKDGKGAKKDKKEDDGGIVKSAAFTLGFMLLVGVAYMSYAGGQGGLANAPSGNDVVQGSKFSDARQTTDAEDRAAAEEDARQRDEEKKASVNQRAAKEGVQKARKSAKKAEYTFYTTDDLGLEAVAAFGNENQYTGQIFKQGNAVQGRVQGTTEEVQVFMDWVKAQGVNAEFNEALMHPFKPGFEILDRGH
jgi:hypothetical protein